MTYYLQYFPTGGTLKSLHYNFRLGASTAFNIVNETCLALWSVLSPIYLRYPKEQDWLRIAAEFEEKSKFPNCCGVVLGKLIDVTAPKKSGSKYSNYKRYFSTNLLAPLPNNNTICPFFIIGDTAYPLHEHIFTPYPGKYHDFSSIQKNYNKELRSVRQNIEKTFGILVKRWRVLSGSIEANPDCLPYWGIILATVVLHNFVKSFDDPAS
ncbi:hypothetical protein Bhyg_02876 [Pseudolycoriella hygida]|uniref:DDE Tnp4 domain-containing protein n=1 Tax=Pseudolycoriella hygida TaxID=35572 RepID=A0A9Q0NCM2_9DIPT|nr:hypothetical protein Bhyg_02876 [Pseudolycoriella hygida]